MTTKTTPLIIHGQRVVTPQGVRPAAVLIRNGVIAGVVGQRNVPRSWRRNSMVYDAGASIVMAGLVDTHVHINEPGRTEWEGFETATKAAAAGGTTTLVDMPLNSIPATTSLGGLRAKQSAARGKCWVDVGFWGGVVPGNSGELRKLHDAGALGFKCFLVPSGVAEFENVSEADLHEALPVLAQLGSALLVHAELPGPIDAAAAKVAGEDPTRYRTWLRSRPPAAEMQAIELMIRLCEKYRVRTHIVHLSYAGSAISMLHRARKRRSPNHRRNMPALSRFFFRLRAGSALQMRTANPRCEKQSGSMGRAATGRHRLRRHRSLAVPARNEMARRRKPLSRMGWHLVARVTAARDVDCGPTAWL